VSSTARRFAALIVVFLLAAGAVACADHLRTQTTAQNSSSAVTIVDQAAVNAAATFPPGAQGDLIRYGHDLIAQTPKYAGQYITSRMSCEACHPNGGRQAHAESLVGTYAMFPQWNRRSKRFIALQDRIAECFLYSMNGRPPAYYSRDMIAISAYIAWLSHGAPTGVGFPNQKAPSVAAAGPPNPANGGRIYAAKCASCHGANGNGLALTYPPLWGPQSFNDKAGMSRMDRIAPFIRVAMPDNAPGTLTDQQAVDVAAFVLAHPRPHFNRNKVVEFPAEKASYF
jgi:thiosulfate dehydrogenase